MSSSDVAPSAPVADMSVASITGGGTLSGQGSPMKSFASPKQTVSTPLAGQKGSHNKDNAAASPKNAAASPKAADQKASGEKTAKKEEAAAVASEDEEDNEPQGPTVTIDPTKDLWFNISANVKESNVEQTETNLLVVGSSGSGKTTLLHRVYSSFGGSGGGGGGSSNKKVKATTALDYSFARRNERNVSQVAHFWELAQGTELAQLSEVVITPENIHAVVVAVVVDASEEGLSTAWDTATYWLKRIDVRVQDILQKMKAKGSSTPAKMLGRAQKLVGEDHPDLPKMRLSGVPTVVVVNKLDDFRADTAKMKLLARSLRYLAHIYGAHLIFTSDAESHKWRALMSHVLFQAPFDAKYIEFDPERSGVLITADKDSFADIGEPNVVNFSTSHKSTGDAELDRWRLPFEDSFPQREAHTGSSLHDPFLKKLYDTSEGGYGEPAIDALRKQKEEELEQYRRSNKVKSKSEKREKKKEEEDDD